MHIKPVQKEKHMFKYKDIEEIISSKKDVQKQPVEKDKDININR